MVQWQWPQKSTGKTSSKVTAPQRHPPRAWPSLSGIVPFPHRQADPIDTRVILANGGLEFKNCFSGRAGCCSNAGSHCPVLRGTGNDVGVNGINVCFGEEVCEACHAMCFKKAAPDNGLELIMDCT